MTSILSIAQNIFDEPPRQKSKKDALHILSELVETGYLEKDTIEEILTHERLTDLFDTKKKKVPKKRSSGTPEERDGVIVEGRCLARIWSGTGKNSNYDNVQCSAKRVEGLGCFCKQHFAKDLACKKIDGLNGWFLGLVTEDKPEKPMAPTGWKAKEQEYSLDPSGGELVEHFWTDSVKPKKRVKEEEEAGEEEGRTHAVQLLDDLPDSSDEEEDSSDEEEETHYEHEGVKYRVSEGKLIDVKSSKVIGHMDGGEPTLTNPKVHKKNVKRLSR